MKSPQEITENSTLIWYPIPDYPNYQITKGGKLRNIKFKNGPKLVKGSTHNRGYTTYALRRENKATTYGLHHILAVTFLNHTWSSPLVVDHIDGNPRNNSLSNLQIITQRQNITKAVNGKGHGATGTQKRGRVYSTQIVFNDKNYYLGCYNTKTEAHNAYSQALKIIQEYHKRPNVTIYHIKQLRAKFTSQLTLFPYGMKEHIAFLKSKQKRN